MSSSMGMATVSLVGVRVARQPIYIPGYVKNGQTIQPSLKVRGLINDRNNKRIALDLTLWGKLADSGAKSLSIGKEFHCTARPESYRGKVFDENRKPLLGKDGTPITVEKVGFVVKDLRYGADSPKQITAEIAAGIRPANWNDGAEGSAAFRSLLDQRKAATYDGKSDTFMFAKVFKSGAMTGAPLQTQVANAVNAVQAAFGNVEELATRCPV